MEAVIRALRMVAKKKRGEPVAKPATLAGFLFNMQATSVGQNSYVNCQEILVKFAYLLGLGKVL